MSQSSIEDYIDETRIINPRSQRLVFTWNNYKNTEQWDLILTEFFLRIDVVYYIYGKEKGEQGTPHLQGYFICNKRIYKNIPGQTKVVCFEDFPYDGAYLGQHMKIWADRYTFIGETKGSQIKIVPRSFFFIVTANYSVMADELLKGFLQKKSSFRKTDEEIDQYKLVLPWLDGWKINEVKDKFWPKQK